MVKLLQIHLPDKLAHVASKSLLHVGVDDVDGRTTEDPWTVDKGLPLGGHQPARLDTAPWEVFENHLEEFIW